MPEDSQILLTSLENSQYFFLMNIFTWDIINANK